MRIGASADMEKRSMRKRGIEAAALFLEKRKYEIVEVNLEEDGSGFPIIALSEDGVICFVDAFVCEGDDAPFPEELGSCDRRCDFEAALVKFLAASAEGFVNRSLRYDRIDIRPLGEERAVLRHHINALA